MKISYSFVTGEVTTVEVSDDIGEEIKKSRTQEESSQKKYTRHNFSSDAAIYEGNDYGACDSYFDSEEEREERERIAEILSQLTPIQRKRCVMLANGKSVDEIAEHEGTSRQTIYESIAAARKKIKKFLKTP